MDRKLTSREGEVCVCVCVFIPRANAFRCIAQPKISALIFLRPTLHSNSHEWHRSSDRLTDLSHVAGTGLRTHVDARRESGVSRFCVFSSCSVVLFSPCFSAFVRACGLVGLPLLLFPVLCSTGHDARAPLECAPHGCRWCPQTILINRAGSDSKLRSVPSQVDCLV